MRRRGCAVLAGMMFGGFLGMVDSLQMVTVSHVRVMARFFVGATLVVFRGQAMVLGGMFVMFSRLEMMLCALM